VAFQLFGYRYSSKYIILCCSADERSKKFIQVWNNLRASKWWQNFHFVKLFFEKKKKGFYLPATTLWSLSIINYVMYSKPLWFWLCSKLSEQSKKNFRECLVILEYNWLVLRDENVNVLWIKIQIAFLNSLDWLKTY